MTSDAALWQRWQQRRDPDAFAEIVSRHAGMVYATCRRILRNAADAQDAAQDCFIELLNGRPKVKSTLAPWLYTVAVRRALNRAKSDVRRRKRERDFAEAPRESAPVSVDDLLEVVDTVIAELPEKLREPVVCRFLDGRSYADIAAATGVAEATIRHRTSKGIERMRASLRRRGIPVSAAALGAALAGTAEAAPPVLAAALGRLAIAGTSAPIAATDMGATVATAAANAVGGVLIMKKVAVAVIAIVVVLVGVQVTRHAMRQKAADSAAPAAAAPTPQREVVAEAAEPAPAKRPDAPAAAAPASVTTVAPPDPAEGAIWVRGMVVDRTDQPVPGATVMGMVKSMPRFREESGPDGRFALQMGIICNGLILQAEKGAYECAPLGPLSVRDNGLNELVLKLDVPCTGSMAGAVVNRNGRPVAGIMVYPNRVPAGFPTEGVTTDGKGAFLLENLAPAHYALVAGFPDDPGAMMVRPLLEVALLPGQSLTNLRIVAPIGESTISGRVVDTKGRSIAGAEVSIHNGFGGAATGADGRFTIRGLDEGTYVVSAVHADFSWAHQPGVAAGADDVELVLKGKGGIEGRVVRADNGEPITGYELFYGRSDSGKPVLLNRKDISDTEGRFVISGINEGDTAVTARAPGFAPAYRVVCVVEHDSVRDVELRLERGTRLEGVVENEQRLPVPGAYLFVGSFPADIEGGAHVARSGADGRFAVDGWPADAAGIAVYHPDYAPLATEVTPGASVRLVLLQPGCVEGTVVQNGKPVPSMMMAAIYPDLRYPYSVTYTEADGTYALDGLAPGTVQVVADMQRFGDGAAQTKMATVESAAVTKVDFEFKEKSASVEGVVSVDGKPAPARLMLHPASNPKFQETDTSGDGYYRFDDVQAGECIMAVSVTTEDGFHATRNLFFAVEEEEVLRVDVPFSRSPNQQIAGTVLFNAREGFNHGIAVFDSSTVVPDPIEPMDLMLVLQSAIAFADCGEDGSYTVHSLQPGRYTVVALEMPVVMKDPNEFRYAIADVKITGDAPAAVDFDMR